MIYLHRINCFTIGLLFFISTVVLAVDDGRVIQLPPSFRTPYLENFKGENGLLRVKPKEKNPWRQPDETQQIKPRIKMNLFPQYDIDSTETDPASNLFKDSTILDKPVTNIFRYTF